MAPVNLEHDPLFELLTDALRAGPDSPQWREAVQRVGEIDNAGGDEFTLLCRARERLAQGREYRALRAGPTFTRRVLDRIEEEASQVKMGVPWANVIAVLSLLVMIGAIVAVVYLWLAPDSGAAGIPADQTFTVEVEYAQPRQPWLMSLVIRDDSSNGRLVLEWFDDKVRLMDGKGSALTRNVFPFDRLRLEIGPKRIKMQGDGVVLWIGEHGLSGEGMRYVEHPMPQNVRRQVRVSIERN